MEILGFVRLVLMDDGRVGLYRYDSSSTVTDGYDTLPYPNGRLVRMNISELGIEDLQTKFKEVSASTYTVLVSDFNSVLESSANQNRTFSLPDASLITRSYPLVIKDTSGNASQRPITIDCVENSNKIDKKASIVIDEDYGLVTIYRRNNTSYSTS